MQKTYDVLFLAMSGVRVKDQELYELGMTLPGFIERSQVIASLPSLSLITIASYCPSHWRPHYLEMDEIDEGCIEDEICNSYDLVAISTFTARAYDAYHIADRIRLNGMTVIMGGLHVSALPEEAKNHADAVVIGQGEGVWERLLADFEENNLKSFYDQKKINPRFRLKQGMLPRYDLIDFNRYNRVTLQTSRGCPLNCSFCAASRTISPFQCKPIEHIRKELDMIYSYWERPFIELADDNTFVNKKWAKELMQLFKRYPMKWFTETDLSVADDDELLELMSESNCAQVLIGFESANQNALMDVDKKNWKYRQFDQYLKKIEKIQSFGISVNGCFILGFDHDDEYTFEKTDAFIKASHLSEVQMTILTPFPGTPLYSSLKEQGRLLKNEFWDECTLFDVTFEPAQMSPKTLKEGFYSLMRSVYDSERVADRKSHFRQCRLNRKKQTLMEESEHEFEQFF